ncbi:venom serine carboxypeptidase-like [Diorhabda carinulata]|uniref:venom serine carboxypeptidase-like n=1 Tax=Diorhabda carinulata TaxID=1163345 RepID=UPI0025A22310|nr:venom serine carboxypeptidase-like [Diorhabda carinulata]
MPSSIVSIFLLIVCISNFDFGLKYEDNDLGQPLFLTPLIENNQISEARRLAEVPSDIFKNVKSYSGYFTVDKNFDSNLFFWFFPAKECYENAPVILWLQGGPGAPSLYAIFNENGPFILKPELELNPYSWTNTHSIIYIDSPVQTGYSFTVNGFAQNETKVGEHLYEALKQFFIIFPELQTNEFFVAGESYAGKYVPAASYTILKKNPTADMKINLKGMAIGSGLCDPENQMKYGEYLYQIGLVDTSGKKKFEHLEKELLTAIRNKNFHKAYLLFDDLLNGDKNGGNTLFKNLTGYNQYFNYLYIGNSKNKGVDLSFTEFIETSNVRKAIHVGDLIYHDGKEVKQHLLEDLMQSVAPWISELLSNIRVLFFNGQLDIIVAYPLTENFLKHLDFDAAEEYKTAVRRKWYVGNELAGYMKQAGNLTEIVVRNSGHMVPKDKPEIALNLIAQFTRNCFHNVSIRKNL